MIQEDYVSFETAKLLEEKGFNRVVFKNSPHYAYNADGQLSGPSWDAEYPAPTLQMAMKWLREKYNLEIYPYHNFYNPKWWFEIIEYPNPVAKYGLGEDEEFDTYEEACEAAIKYCLENLI